MKFKLAKIEQRPAPAEDAIVPIGEEPQYHEAQAVLSVMTRAARREEARIDLMRCERERARLPRDYTSQRAEELTLRIRRLRADLGEKPAAPPRPQFVPQEIEAALKAIATDEAPANDPDTTIARARRMLDILYPAIRSQSSICAEMHSELSFVLAQRLRPYHDKLVALVHEAALALSEAMIAEREFRDRLVLAGYYASPCVLEPPKLPAAYQLGDEAHANSQLYAFRRQLVARGIVKEE